MNLFLSYIYIFFLCIYIKYYKYLQLYNLFFNFYILSLYICNFYISSILFKKNIYITDK